MLFELIIFAIVLAVSFVGAQLIGGYFMMKIVMSPKFITKYTKQIMKTTVEVTKELEDMLED